MLVCLVLGLLFIVPLAPDDQEAIQTVAGFYGARAGQRMQVAGAGRQGETGSLG